jgi:DNA mismatch endonuclease (patch repair protein)
MRARRNGPYWAAKIAKNVERDVRNNTLLRHAGWDVVRGWEHESCDAVADRVAAAVYLRRRDSDRN